jgi:hypothetical protein
MGNKNNSVDGRNIASAIGLGVVISVALMMIGTFVVTALLMNRTIEIESIGVPVLAVTELSVLIGCAFSTLRTRKSILPVAVATSLFFFIIQIGITALFFDGQYHGVVVTLVTVLGGAIATSLVVLKHLNHSKQFHRKR